jgi:hypothetical protein
MAKVKGSISYPSAKGTYNKNICFSKKKERSSSGRERCLMVTCVGKVKGARLKYLGCRLKLQIFSVKLALLHIENKIYVSN